MTQKKAEKEVKSGKRKTQIKKRDRDEGKQMRKSRERDNML